MGSMPEQVTVGWTFGEDPFLVASSLVEQLGLEHESFRQALFKLIVSHEEKMNLRLPSLAPRSLQLYLIPCTGAYMLKQVLFLTRMPD